MAPCGCKDEHLLVRASNAAGRGEEMGWTLMGISGSFIPMCTSYCRVLDIAPGRDRILELLISLVARRVSNRTWKYKGNKGAVRKP